MDSLQSQGTEQVCLSCMMFDYGFFQTDAPTNPIILSKILAVNQLIFFNLIVDIACIFFSNTIPNSIWYATLPLSFAQSLSFTHGSEGCPHHNTGEPMGAYVRCRNGKQRKAKATAKGQHKDGWRQHGYEKVDVGQRTREELRLRKPTNY